MKQSDSGADDSLSHRAVHPVRLLRTHWVSDSHEGVKAVWHALVSFSDYFFAGSRQRG